jgi:radical SAM superfamily enzyme YgiQ (UPF0313 family)
MNVVLIQPPFWGVKCPPLHIALLSSYLRTKGHKVQVFDFNVELYQARTKRDYNLWEPQEEHLVWMNPNSVSEFLGRYETVIDRLINSVMETDPAVVGFSVHFSSELPSLFLAQRIKEINPKVVTIFGGPQASRDQAAYRLVAEQWVDYVVQGEGEETLSEIIRYIDNGELIYDCPGIIFQNDGQVKDCGDRELIKDLNILPFADFSDFEFSKYKEPFTLPMYTSRGCPNRCVFCTERIYWRRYRFRDGENIFAEIKYQLNKMKMIDFIDFHHDSLLNGNTKELEKLCDLIIQNGIKIRWAGQAIIRKEMTKELLEKMKEAGCVSLTYGLETASPRIMERMGKVMAKGADIDQIVKDTYNAGIDPMINFIIGFPGETEEDFEQSIRFCERNKNYIFSVNPSLGFCYFEKGSYVYFHPDEFDIELGPGGPHWRSKDRKNNYITRLYRFEKFCQAIANLGIRNQYPYETLLNRNFLIGTGYIYLGEYEKAIEFLEISIKEDPISKNESTLRETLRHLATAYEKLGYEDKANKCHEEIFESFLREGNYSVGKDKFESLLKLGNYPDAIGIARKIINSVDQYVTTLKNQLFQLEYSYNEVHKQLSQLQGQITPFTKTLQSKLEEIATLKAVIEEKEERYQKDIAILKGVIEEKEERYQKDIAALKDLIEEKNKGIINAIEQKFGRLSYIPLIIFKLYKKGEKFLGRYKKR